MDSCRIVAAGACWGRAVPARHWCAAAAQNEEKKFVRIASWGLSHTAKPYCSTGSWAATDPAEAAWRCSSRGGGSGSRGGAAVVAAATGPCTAETRSGMEEAIRIAGETGYCIGPCATSSASATSQAREPPWMVTARVSRAVLRDADWVLVYDCACLNSRARLTTIPRWETCSHGSHWRQTRCLRRPRSFAKCGGWMTNQRLPLH